MLKFHHGHFYDYEKRPFRIYEIHQTIYFMNIFKLLVSII